MIAIEPVIAPAASLIAISTAFEAIESAAAPLLVRIIARSGPRPAPSGAPASMPRRAAAVADLVLLGVAQLGGGALVVGAGVVGDEGRVVAEAALAARLLDQAPLPARLEDVLGAVLFDQGERADVEAPALVAGRGDLAQELLQVLLVARPLAAVAGRVDPRAPVERRPRRCRSRRRRPPRRSPRAPPAPCPARSRRTTRRPRAAARRPPAAAPARPPAAARAARAACACCRWRRSSARYPLLGLAEALDPPLGEAEQLVERGARERRALGRRLDLDQAALAGHHDVGVDLGGRVLGVVEVAERPPVDHADADRGDRPVSGSASISFASTSFCSARRSAT